MRRMLLIIALLGLTTSAFAANDINNLPALNQGQFHGLSEDLGAILTAKQLQSAAPGGVSGFGLGLDLSSTQLAHQSDWDVATDGSGVNTIPMARLSINKGLPLGFDIGGFYSGATNSNVHAWGADLRYAILDGGVFMPALGVRAAYSSLSGVSGLSFSTRSVDLTISKSLGPISPYAGIGRVWVNSRPDASTGLREDNFSVDESFVGVAVNLGLRVALELNRTAGNNTYSLKLGFGF